MCEFPRINEIKEDFSYFDDWEDKYGYLIDLSKKLPEMDESLKTDSHLVPGCMSRVWMVPIVKGDHFSFLADSDAIIVRGLIGILFASYHNQEKSALASIDIDQIFKDLGLEQNISPNRRNGFFAMVEKIKSFS